MKLSREQFHRVAAAVAEASSYEILRQVNLRFATTPGQIASHLSISRPTISHHIRKLQLAGLIHVEIEGRFRFLMARHDTWGNFVEDLLELDMSAHFQTRLGKKLVAASVEI